MAQSADPHTESVERVLLSAVEDSRNLAIQPPTYREVVVARLLGRLLYVICALAAVFLGLWTATRPSLAQVGDLLGSSADPKAALDALHNLRRDHFDHFRSLFQLLVLSGLVPLFTLLAGYAFGTREKAQNAQHGGEGEEEA